MIVEALMWFIATFVVEFVVLALFVRKDLARTVLYVFLINAFTWPIANILSAFGFTIVVEVGVFLVEAVLISLLFEKGRRESLVMSGVANFLSLFAGFFVVWFI